MNALNNTFPTITELEQNTNELLKKYPDQVQRRTLGKSRSGREIELISIGEGKKSALVIGVPHPNEPVGARTVEYLIDQVLSNPEVQQLGFRWHFIKAIDPEGLRLNEVWCTAPLTLKSYLHNHFRPALANQPEYSFPLLADDYQFDAPTPENLCWQKALELTRPDLQASLHHADHGGVFHVISDELQPLTEKLQAIAMESGLGVNPLGDPSAPAAPFAAGVFPFPDPVDILKRTEGKGWPAGDTSASFAAQKYGTASITTEVPLWHDPRLLDQSPSGKTMGRVLQQQLEVFETLSGLLKAHVPNLEVAINNADEQELFAALKEWQMHSDGFGAELKAASGMIDPDMELPTNLYALRSQLTLAAMRPAGLMRRLSADLLSSDRGGTALKKANSAADEFLNETIALFEQDAVLQPVDIDRLCKIQADSLLAVAAHIGGIKQS